MIGPMKPTSAEGLHFVSVVGARPQFVKASAVHDAIDRWQGSVPIRHSLIHTGQHYDAELSAVFFEELRLPIPAAHLHVGSGSHHHQIGETIQRLEQPLRALSPDLVMVYGDTDATAGAALATAHLNLPLVHVEAGLRSWDWSMPEERNRVLADHLSAVNFCPSDTSAANLTKEGLGDSFYVAGDVMLDVLELHRPTELEQGEPYAVASVHREDNVTDRSRLNGIMRGLEKVAEAFPVRLPLHPRTRDSIGNGVPESIQVCEPLPYEEMVNLVAGATLLITDSGGLQKEAYWLGIPCVTLRDRTEWPETVNAGWNVLVDANPELIAAAALTRRHLPPRPPIYGSPGASDRIVQYLSDWLASGGLPHPYRSRQSPGGGR